MNLKKKDKILPTILIVDDSPEICEVLISILQSRNKYNLITAFNGEEGISQALKYNPELIIMDLHMPVMNGLESTRILKNTKKTQHIPIIMLTSCVDKKANALDVGCDFFETKPIMSKALFNRVDLLIKSKKQ